MYHHESLIHYTTTRGTESLSLSINTSIQGCKHMQYMYMLCIPMLTCFYSCFRPISYSHVEEEFNALGNNLFIDEKKKYFQH